MSDPTAAFHRETYSRAASSEKLVAKLLRMRTKSYTLDGSSFATMSALMIERLPLGYNRLNVYSNYLEHVGQYLYWQTDFTKPVFKRTRAEISIATVTDRVQLQVQNLTPFVDVDWGVLLDPPKDYGRVVTLHVRISYTAASPSTEQKFENPFIRFHLLATENSTRDEVTAAIVTIVVDRSLKNVPDDEREGFYLFETTVRIRSVELIDELVWVPCFV